MVGAGKQPLCWNGTRKKSWALAGGTILEILVVKRFCRLLPLNSADKMGLVRGGVVVPGLWSR